MSFERFCQPACFFAARFTLRQPKTPVGNATDLFVLKTIVMPFNMPFNMVNAKQNFKTNSKFRPGMTFTPCLQISLIYRKTAVKA